MGGGWVGSGGCCRPSVVLLFIGIRHVSGGPVCPAPLVHPLLVPPLRVRSAPPLASVGTRAPAQQGSDWVPPTCITYRTVPVGYVPVLGAGVGVLLKAVANLHPRPYAPLKDQVGANAETVAGLAPHAHTAVARARWPSTQKVPVRGGRVAEGLFRVACGGAQPNYSPPGARKRDRGQRSCGWSHRDDSPVAGPSQGPPQRDGLAHLQ